MKQIMRIGSIGALLLLAACVSTAPTVQQIDQLETAGENPRIVLMPPDIRYYLITTGGVPEPHAEWTEAAQTNFATAIDNYAKSIGADLTVIDQTNMSQTEVSYEELHSAVGATIMGNYLSTRTLPAKNGQFDWSLGPEISSIGEEHDADYALFVFYRDMQASGGKVAFSILKTAAMMGRGYSSTGDSESGFASLVDLRTGDIVWFNYVYDGAGELRNAEGAEAAVAVLFKDIPRNNKQ